MSTPRRSDVPRRRDVFIAQKHARKRNEFDVWLARLRADIARGTDYFWDQPHRRDARPADPVFAD